MKGYKYLNPGKYPFSAATEHILSTTAEAFKTQKGNATSMKFQGSDLFYVWLGAYLASLLENEINTAMAGRIFGTGKQTGNGKVEFTATNEGVTLTWIGRNILYIEYGTGKEGVEHPYEGGEMIDGYMPEDHGWVAPYTNKYTEGWEPIAPFYTFSIKAANGVNLDMNKIADALGKARIPGAVNYIVKDIKSVKPGTIVINVVTG